MDPNSRLDRFALYLLHFSAYYDVETACFHFYNITSMNELLLDQMRCSITNLLIMKIEEKPKAPTSATIHTTSSRDWFLLCEELSISYLSCMMMTTTRR